MKNIKEELIEEYKELGHPLSLNEFSRRHYVDLSEDEIKALKVKPIDNLHGLTFEQAFELVNFYGKGFLFSQEIEINIENYFQTKKRIAFIENERA